MRIEKTERTDGVMGYEYTLIKQENDLIPNDHLPNPSIKVIAEIGGHGCLFGIEIPPMAIQSGCHSGPEDWDSLDDIIYILNRIFIDYHVSKCVINSSHQDFQRIISGYTGNL